MLKNLKDNWVILVGVIAIYCYWSLSDAKSEQAAWSATIKSAQESP